ncbi:di-heme oxidoredictase family protein [Thiocystis violascens]|uniref:Putative thiol oxidoreductase n=1 Tax=Thiocystis violascens (strain ATCC 17096 / DSM 198 / 6111) TaxID=765911 RepID=I3Y5F0_THIV6|nr:di-heme oxidoredictase family protein [Thiocystis violascens]AFL72218.1 putative thiol oxidoreductase [Thiocystis violascens DSM 198]
MRNPSRRTVTIPRTWAHVLAAAALAGAGQAVQAHKPLGSPPSLADEYYAGGRQGTVFSATSRAMELPSPAINADPRLSELFAEGEVIFDADYVTDPDAPFGGLGPIYNNISCMNCHPNYGRARRVDKWTTQFGNGYTALVHTPDGKLVDGYLFMLQTMTVPPYVPLAKDVTIAWKPFVDRYGNRYPDGTPYNQGKPTEGTLTYPTADLVEPLLPLPEDYRVSLEATIGLYGTGLLDAIRDEDIVAEHERQKAAGGAIQGQLGKRMIESHDGREHIGKFTWHNTRATLQNGPGFNGMWNVFNLNREDRPQLFASAQWIDKQAALGLDVSALKDAQPVEISQKQLDALMVWHRGLGVPAARNLDKPRVKRGRALFHKTGCVECHKPCWTTGPDEFIPAYAGQTIWPYTDMLMHDMGEENRGLLRTYRTPPLWGRGLMRTTVDHSDMFHDLRARDFEEAILWHFGEAEGAREIFRNLPAEDRAALIEFVKSI